MGINGACRSIEIANIKSKDVEYHNDIILVKLRETKTNVDRSFAIRDEFVNLVKKYKDLRPKDMKSDNFFINYKNGKCTRQNIGRHKIAAMPKEIAAYLNLENPEAYTGHCFRRSSATLLADAGANLLTLKRHGGWKSDRVAEGYVEDSVENKIKITKQIHNNIKLDPLNCPEPSTSNQEDQFTNPHPSTSRQQEPILQLSNPQPSGSNEEKADVTQTNISVPGKSIRVSIENCPNMNNVTINIS